MLSTLSSHRGSPRPSRLQLKELFRWVDEITALPDPINATHGYEGDKGFISIIDRGFILHAYFTGEIVRYELYGPFAPGTERSPRPPKEDHGLEGSMSIACLKDVIRLLDDGRSPLEYIRSNALQAASDRT